nr:GHKL domain-containing protein [Oceanobacillus saliphilus]
MPVEVPIYITSLIVFGLVYVIHKKLLLPISILGTYWNGLFFAVQCLLAAIYLFVPTSWVYSVPLILFIWTEAIHIAFSSKLFASEKQIKEMVEERDQMNETFRTVRAQRHDYLKHVSAIHFMLEKGGNAEAKAYLDEIVDEYEETNLSIKGERGSIAAMLHQMYNRAKSSGISAVYHLDLPLSTLPLSDTDLVNLVGNLLSNSIDACEEWQKERKEQASLTLQFYKRSGLYLLICKNSTLPIPNDMLDSLFHTYGKTTKAGHHEGLGTKIIHDTVKEYKGLLDFTYRDQEFTVKIKIPAIR